MFKSIMTFLAGAVVGAAGAYVVVNAKLEKAYAEKAVEEAEALDELLDRRIKAQQRKAAAKTPTKEEKAEAREAHKSEVIKNKYMPREDVERKVEDSKTPFVIKPQEFGEGPQDEVNWVFWADGIISDEGSDEIMSERDIEKYIGGRDMLGRIGEYEDDAVYIRNEYLCFDVYLRREDREYKDVVGPYDR